MRVDTPQDLGLTRPTVTAPAPLMVSPSYSPEVQAQIRSELAAMTPDQLTGRLEATRAALADARTKGEAQAVVKFQAGADLVRSYLPQEQTHAAHPSRDLEM